MTIQEELLTKTQSSGNIHTDLQQRKTTVTFFGHFGLGNFGNESTLQAILYHLRQELPGAELSCICTGPATTASTRNIKAVPISRMYIASWAPEGKVARAVRSFVVGIPCELYRWLRAFMMLKGTDVLVVPGTGLLTDAYCLRGWGPYSMFKWSLLAKMRGAKLLFVSVGAGPLYSRIGRLLVKCALTLADYRSYRDASSMQYLKSIGFEGTNDRVYPDLVFSLPQYLVPRCRDKSGRRTVVGIGLMLYADRYSVDRPIVTTYTNYLEQLAILVQWLLAHDYDVRLLIGDLCDRPVTEEFQYLLRERLSICDSSRIIDERVVSVEQLLSQLAETDLVVATRFHNILLALLCNKPTIAITFHHKCASLMSAMGLAEYCLNINDLKAAELIDKMRDIEMNTDKLKSLLRERVAESRKALDEQYEMIFKDMNCTR